MHVITIDASAKQLSKLRNGLPVRIKKGSGFNLIVHPESYKLVSRAFAKNKGLEIKLSPEEIDMNKGLTPEEHMAMKEANPDIAGQGIFGKKFDKFLKKAGIKKAVYDVGDVLKPYAKGAITAGLATGATALGGIAPELIPFLPAGVAGLSSMAHDYLDNPSKYQGKSGIKAPRVKSLAEKVSRTKANELLNRELGTNYDYMSRAGLAKAADDFASADFNTDSIRARYGLPPSRSMSGHGLGGGMHHREISSIGRGAGMLKSGFHAPPALVSQPLSANFQMSHFLPPQYQHYNSTPASGSGLYAGGRGSGLFA